MESVLLMEISQHSVVYMDEHPETTMKMESSDQHVSRLLDLLQILPIQVKVSLFS